MSGRAGPRISHRPSAMHEIGKHIKFGATEVEHVPNVEDPTFVKEVVPLFRFGSPSDVMTDLIEIGSKVFVKVFKPLLEIIIHEGVSENDIRFIGSLILHAHGPFFVNIPSKDDPMRLLQLGQVDDTTRLRDIQAAITGALSGNAWPIHFVLRADFKVRQSIFVSKWVSPEGIDHMRKHLTFKEIETRI